MGPNWWLVKLLRRCRLVGLIRLLLCLSGVIRSATQTSTSTPNPKSISPKATPPDSAARHQDDEILDICGIEAIIELLNRLSWLKGIVLLLVSCRCMICVR